MSRVLTLVMVFAAGPLGCAADVAEDEADAAQEAVPTQLWQCGCRCSVDRWDGDGLLYCTREEFGHDPAAMIAADRNSAEGFESGHEANCECDCARVTSNTCECGAREVNVYVWEPDCDGPKLPPAGAP